MSAGGPPPMGAGGPPTLTDILGYDPWTFPQLLNPNRDFAYVAFGWTIYEVLECGTLLYAARKKGTTSAYWVLCVALIFQLFSLVLEMISYGSSTVVVEDYYAASVEFGLRAFSVTSEMVSRWAFLFAATQITLSLSISSQMVKMGVYALAALGAIGSTWYTVAFNRWLHLSSENYNLYVETGDSSAIASKPSFMPIVAAAQHGELAMMIPFLLLTKIPFINHTVTQLKSSGSAALLEVAAMGSTQRILVSSGWVLVEIGIMAAFGPGVTVTAMRLFSMTFQIHTMAMLAFTPPPTSGQSNRASTVRQSDKQEGSATAWGSSSHGARAT